MRFNVAWRVYKYHLRRFTPELEMDLCGHATLVTAFVIMNEIGYHGDSIVFDFRSGELIVRKEKAYFKLDFPARPPIPAKLLQSIADAITKQPVEVWKARDYLL